MAQKKVTPRGVKAKTAPVAKAPAKPAAVKAPAKVAAAPAPEPVVEPVIEAAAAPAAEPVISEPVAEISEPVIAAAAQAAVEPFVETTQAFNEGMNKMQNDATQAVTDRVQAIFGDVNERARALIEKNNRLVEELTELTRGNVEALVTSSKVAAKGVETLGQEAADYGRKSFEEASSALRSFAEVKSPTDLFRLQSEFAKTQFDSIVAESSRLSEAVIKLAGEVFEPISSRYTVAAERVKNVVAA